MRRRLNRLPPGRRFGGALPSPLSRPCRLASQLAWGRKHDHSAGFCFWEDNVLFLFSTVWRRRTRDWTRSGEVARRAGSGRSTAMPPSVQNAHIRPKRAARRESAYCGRSRPLPWTRLSRTSLAATENLRSGFNRGCCPVRRETSRSRQSRVVAIARQYYAEGVESSRSLGFHCGNLPPLPCQSPRKSPASSASILPVPSKFQEQRPYRSNPQE